MQTSTSESMRKILHLRQPRHAPAKAPSPPAALEKTDLSEKTNFGLEKPSIAERSITQRFNRNDENDRSIEIRYRGHSAANNAANTVVDMRKKCFSSASARWMN